MKRAEQAAPPSVWGFVRHVSLAYGRPSPRLWAKSPVLAALPIGCYNKLGEEKWGFKGALAGGAGFLCVLLKEADRQLPRKHLAVVCDHAVPGPSSSATWGRPDRPDSPFPSLDPFWELGNWTHCSASCGPLGVHIQRPQCVLANGREVSEACCGHVQMPLAGVQPCIIRDCPVRYMTSLLLSQYRVVACPCQRNNRSNVTFCMKYPFISRPCSGALSDLSRFL